MQIESKLREVGLWLPDAPEVPPCIRHSFGWVRIHAGRADIARHGPLNPDGFGAGPIGKVEAEI
jgi:hypothetical protein